MSGGLYDEPGAAYFVCEEHPFAKAPPETRSRYGELIACGDYDAAGELIPDGVGHAAYYFVWAAGSHHIDDAVFHSWPTCAHGCDGFVLISGTDPRTAASNDKP